MKKQKKNEDKYNKYFDDTYILQTIIHLNLNNNKNITGTISNDKFDLYKIFDSYNVDINKT